MGGDDADDPVVETPITIKVFPDRVPSYSGRTENASLVAFQDRDRAWVALTGTGGIYHATATGRRYGVAVGCGAPAAPAVPGITVYYQSVADMTEVLADGCRTEMDTVRVLVEVQGLQASQTGDVSLGNINSHALTGLTALIDHPRGPVDLFVRTFTTNGAQVDPVKLYRGPTLDLQTNQTLQIDIDKVGSPPEGHALTLTGLDPSETIIVDSSYTTPHSEMRSFPLWSPLGAEAPDHYVTVDASQRQPDDITSVDARVLGPFANGQRSRRSAGVAMRTPTAQTLQLPPVWTAPAPTVERSAVPRATFTILIMAPTLGTSDYLASFVTPSSAHIVSAVVRQGYALGAPSVTITTPDLSSLPGWTADMGLVPTEPVSWDLEWLDRNMPRETPVVDGRRVLDSEILGRLTP